MVMQMEAAHRSYVDQAMTTTRPTLVPQAEIKVKTIMVKAELWH